MSRKPIIVCVDDDPDILRIYKRGLASRRCYEIKTFDRPTDALDWVGEHPDEVALVITDFRMPILNGHDVVAEIRKFDGELPVFCVTGMDAALIDAQLFARVLAKPFDLAELQGLIFEYLRTTPSAKSMKSEASAIPAGPP